VALMLASRRDVLAPRAQRQSQGPKHPEENPLLLVLNLLEPLQQSFDIAETC